jgi:hypothetical protein
VKLLGEQPSVLADTGPLCRLAEAGEVQLDVAAQYLAPALNVVKDVEIELRRRATFPVHARLRRLELLGIPRQEAITLTDAQLLSRVQTILDRRRSRYPDHDHKDRGEVVTAVTAGSLGMPVLMDEGWGKRLAQSEGVEIFTTEDLAVELAAVGKLRSLHAFAIFRIVYSNADRSVFDQRVSDLQAELTRRGNAP